MEMLTTYEQKELFHSNPHDEAEDAFEIIRMWLSWLNDDEISNEEKDSIIETLQRNWDNCSDLARVFLKGILDGFNILKEFLQVIERD